MARPKSHTRIYVNGRFLTQRMTGVQRYAHESLKAMDALLDHHATFRWTILAPKGTDPKEKWKNFEFRTIGFLSGHAWEQFELPFYASDGWLLTLSGAPTLCHSKHLFVIPDAAIYDMPDGYSFIYRTYYRTLYRLCLARAKAIFTVSEFSRSRLVTLFPSISDRVFVTFNGVDHSNKSASCKPSIGGKITSAGRPYVLAVSSLAPNKNFNIILKLSEVLDDPNLRIVVAGSSNAKVFARSELSASRIEWLGYVSDEELGGLYCHAACFIFPSLYEGFGLPPIEAMSHGCSVIASNAASIPEICGDAALYFNPHSAEDLNSQIIRMLHEPGLVDDLRRKGKQQAKRYTWTEVARTILHSISTVAEKSIRV